MLKAAVLTAMLLAPPAAQEAVPCQWLSGDGMYADIDWKMQTIKIEWQSGVEASCQFQDGMQPYEFDLVGCGFDPATLTLVPYEPYTRAETFSIVVLAGTPLYWSCPV